MDRMANRLQNIHLLNIGPSAVVSPKAMITRNVKGGGVK